MQPDPGVAVLEVVVGEERLAEGGVVGLGPNRWSRVGGLQSHRGLGPGAAPEQARWAPSRQDTQNSRGVPGKDARKDWFGTSLELGDLDRNGYADLVVGSPGENKGRGQVTVIRGARSGWKTSGNYSYSQNSKGIPGKAERGDWFGWRLSLLDHNHDGRLDLRSERPSRTSRRE